MFKKTKVKETIITKLFFLHNDYITNNKITFNILKMNVMFDKLDGEGQKTHTVYDYYSPLDNNPITLEHATLSRMFNRVVVSSAEYYSDGKVSSDTEPPLLSKTDLRWLNKLYKRHKNE
jgi:hypothetical protein